MRGVRRRSSDGGARRPRRASDRGDAAGGAPVAEPGPGPQVLAQLVEAFFDLGSHGPVAVAAVPELVDGGSLATADALFEHGLKTASRRVRLRLFVLLPPGCWRI